MTVPKCRYASTIRGELEDPGKKSIYGWALVNTVQRVLYMFVFALRTAARRRKSFPMFKNITARKTLGGCDVKSFSFGIHRARYMRKMLIDFFFADTNHFRQVSATCLILI